jgi:hypothetical protein
LAIGSAPLFDPLRIPRNDLRFCIGCYRLRDSIQFCFWYQPIQFAGGGHAIVVSTKEKEAEDRNHTKQETYPANMLNDKKEKKLWPRV